jgi:hypothetical protein
MARAAPEVGDRLRMCVEAADAGEDELAFEDLCSNLYDFGVPISEDEFDEIVNMAEHLRLPAARWEFVRELRPSQAADLGAVAVEGVFDDHQVTLTGTPDGLADLARRLPRHDGVASLLTGVPGTRRLESIEVASVAEPTLLIRRSGARLYFSGHAQAISVLAANIESLAGNPAGLGGHLHIEYYPEHPYIRRGSIPLVVSVRNAR